MNILLTILIAAILGFITYYAALHMGPEYAFGIVTFILVILCGHNGFWNFPTRN